MPATALFDKPNRKWIPVELAFARFHRSNNNEDGVEHPEENQEWDPDEHQAQDSCNRVVDEHGELKVERLLAMCIDLGGFAAFDQPNDQRTKDVAEEMKN